MTGYKEVALVDGKLDSDGNVTKGEHFGCPELEMMFMMPDDGRD